MGHGIQTAETAAVIAESYGEAECVGTVGEVVDTTREDGRWIVTFRTHTFSDEYTHRIEITASVGNVVSHERTEAPA